MGKGKGKSHEKFLAGLPPQFPQKGACPFPKETHLDEE